MTTEEKKCIMALVEAWNLFIKLPIEHDDDTEDMRRIIHAANAQIFKRVGRREFNFWASSQ